MEEFYRLQQEEEENKSLVFAVSDSLIKRKKRFENIEFSLQSFRSNYPKDIRKRYESFLAYIEKEQQFLNSINKSLIKENIIPDCEIDGYQMYKKELKKMHSLTSYLLHEA